MEYNLSILEEKSKINKFGKLVYTCYHKRDLCFNILLYLFIFFKVHTKAYLS